MTWLGAGLLATRSGQSAFYGPASAKAQVNHVARESVGHGPFGDGFGFSVERDSKVVPFVVRVDDARHPTAVLRGVASVVVGTVKLKAFSALSHVGKEGCKVRTPAITDGNSTRAVVGKQRVALDVTAPLDSAPDTVFACFGSSVRSREVAARLSHKAPTATRMPSTEIRGRNDCLAPAITSTAPTCVPRRHALKNSKTTALESREVSAWSWHGVNNTIFGAI